MWRTPVGRRVLTSTERALFVRAAALLADHLPGGARYNPLGTGRSGVDVFDRLHAPTRVVLLAEVTRALTKADIPCPRRRAAADGAIFAVFCMISVFIRFEISMRLPMNQGSWRAAVARTWREVGGPGPVPAASDQDGWDDLLDALVARVLLDHCCFHRELLGSRTNPGAAELREMLGLPDDYFARVRADPDLAETARECLHCLADKVLLE
jgi:hypothetical protein